jgi:hypothetical protein
MSGWLVSAELERIWISDITAAFSWETQGNYDSHESMSPGRDVNPRPPEYNARIRTSDIRSNDLENGRSVLHGSYIMYGRNMLIA